MVSAETANLGESSRESAIISAERSKYDPDRSLPTMTTSLQSRPSTTNISGVSSLPSTSKLPASEMESKENDEEQKKDDKENNDSGPDGTEEPNETVLQKAKGWFEFFRSFFESILISLTSTLNSVSRDYRFVAKRLSTEKKCFKKILEIEESRGQDHGFISEKTKSKLSHVTEDMLHKLVDAQPDVAMQQWQELETEAAER